MQEKDQTLRDYLSEIGTKGGIKRSEKKRLAALANLAKANAKNPKKQPKSITIDKPLSNVVEYE